MRISRRSDDPPLRQQLLDARAAILRQLAILRSPAGASTVYTMPPDNRGLILRLSAQLEAIEEALEAEAGGGAEG